jgi:hypothetical protein
MNVPTYNPVYKSMNKPLTVWGVERRLFFVAMVVGAATFSCFNSLLGAILMFSTLLFCAKQATRTDAQILRVLLNSSRFMKHFLSLNQAAETSGGTIAAPVFYLQCPSIPEESRLYSAILLKLCKKFRPSAPAQEKLVFVQDALSRIEIRILALDEVNFTEVGTAAKQKRF